MLRWIGAALIVLCGGLAGFYKAGLLRERVRQLRLALELLEQIATQLRYTRTPTGELIGTLAEEETFSSFRFLRQCDRLLRTGTAFPQAFAQSLEEAGDGLQLSGEDIRQLLRLKDILGSSDVEGQLSGLALLRTQLQKNLAAAEEAQRVKGKLFRSLGVLCGIAIAIMIL